MDHKFDKNLKEFYNIQGIYLKFTSVNNPKTNW